MMFSVPPGTMDEKVSARSWVSSTQPNSLIAHCIAGEERNSTSHNRLAKRRAIDKCVPWRNGSSFMLVLLQRVAKVFLFGVPTRKKVELDLQRSHHKPDEVNFWREFKLALSDEEVSKVWQAPFQILSKLSHCTQATLLVSSWCLSHFLVFSMGTRYTWGQKSYTRTVLNAIEWSVLEKKEHLQKVFVKCMSQEIYYWRFLRIMHSVNL